MMPVYHEKQFTKGKFYAEYRVIMNCTLLNVFQFQGYDMDGVQFRKKVYTNIVSGLMTKTDGSATHDVLDMSGNGASVLTGTYDAHALYWQLTNTEAEMLLMEYI